MEEFKEYCVLEECKLTFSLREFKACVGLAEGWGTGVEVNFSDGDEPLFVRLRLESAVAGEFVIATTKGDRGAGGSGKGNGNEGGGGNVRVDAGDGVDGGQSRDGSNVQQGQPVQEKAGIAASVASSSRSAQPASRSTSSSSTRPPQPPADTSLPSQPVPPKPSESTRAIPNESTPLPPPQHQHPQEEDNETQPLFFPGASQLSLQPSQPTHLLEEVMMVQPTPVALGGDPGEFLAPAPDDDAEMQNSLALSQRSAERDVGGSDSDSDGERGEREGTEGPRKRFKPML